MTAVSTKPCLSAVFVDYDNIYLSLKRKNDEAARRFAKDAGSWVKEIASGRLITPTNDAFGSNIARRTVMSRCYGNPVPRRNSQDNSTDMNSFPFVRHHFLRSGFEVVDCPPLTAQLKNSSDIRMVMDVSDLLNHDTYFDEFVILSGDADFTPLLHRLRAHARRTVIFANDYTVAPYTSISDGEIREADLINLLLEGRLPGEADGGGAVLIETDGLRNDAIRKEIIDEVVSGLRAAAAPVPLEALADRALRSLGHDKTAGTSWAGAGSFRELLAQHLPEELCLSEAAPYYAYDRTRHQSPDAITAEPPLNAIAPPQQIAAPAAEEAVRETAAEITPALAAPAQAAPAQAAPDQAAPDQAAPDQATPAQARPAQAMPAQAMPAQAMPAFANQPAASADIALRPPLGAEQSYAAATSSQTAPAQGIAAEAIVPQALAPLADQAGATAAGLAAVPVERHVTAAADPQALPTAAPAPQDSSTERAALMQQSIARIHDACQAPPIAPAEYRVLFDVMAGEINENGLTGAQTLTNIAARAQAKGIEISRDDVRFVLEVVSEADPWFEQGASANLFAGRFRNFVVARCRGQGLNMSAEEVDLIDAWFAGSDQRPLPSPSLEPASQQRALAPQAQPQSAPPQTRTETLKGEAHGLGARQAAPNTGEQIADPADVVPGEEFPRIIRSRLRG